MKHLSLSVKSIKISDRAAIVNFMVGLDGYTISSGIFPKYLHGDSTALWVLILFELIIATIGTIATTCWIGAGMAIQKVYLQYYRPINIILALTLLECVYSILTS